MDAAFYTAAVCMVALICAYAWSAKRELMYIYGFGGSGECYLADDKYERTL